jgi:hypothetical protein
MRPQYSSDSASRAFKAAFKNLLVGFLDGFGIHFFTSLSFSKDSIFSLHVSEKHLLTQGA